MAVSTTPMFHSHMCRPERHRQGPKREGQWLGPRAVSRAMRGAYSAYTPQFSRISLRCWDLHWHLSIWHSPHSHVRFPFSDLRGTSEAGARTRGSAVAARVSRARHMRGAHSPQVSRITACGVGTCIGTYNGKRNGEERARPACKGRFVGGAYSGSREIRHRAMARHE